MGEKKQAMQIGNSNAAWLRLQVSGVRKNSAFQLLQKILKKGKLLFKA